MTHAVIVKPKQSAHSVLSAVCPDGYTLGGSMRFFRINENLRTEGTVILRTDDKGTASLSYLDEMRDEQEGNPAEGRELWVIDTASDSLSLP